MRRLSQRLADCTFFADIRHDPDGAIPRVIRIDGFGRGACPECGTVLAPILYFVMERAARSEYRAGTFGKSLVSLRRGIQRHARESHEFFRQIAEYLGAKRIARDHHAVARE